MSSDTTPTAPDAQADLLLDQGIVVAIDGEKIGDVGHVYLDETTGRIGYVTVATGWFGTRQTLVPVQNAAITVAEIKVPFIKDVIKGAPHIEADATLTADEERELHHYYSVSPDTAEAERVGAVSPDSDGEMDWGIDGTESDAVEPMDAGGLSSAPVGAPGETRLRRYEASKG